MSLLHYTHRDTCTHCTKCPWFSSCILACTDCTRSHEISYPIVLSNMDCISICARSWMKHGSDQGSLSRVCSLGCGHIFLLPVLFQSSPFLNQHYMYIFSSLGFLLHRVFHLMSQSHCMQVPFIIATCHFIENA